MEMWERLWEIVRRSMDDDAELRIEITDSMYEVYFVYADGSRNLLVWRDGAWEFAEPPCSFPCDVAARDAD